MPHRHNCFQVFLSNGIILSIFFLIVLGGLYKKIDVFDAFVDGAKGGFETAVRIIPYIVGMLIAISMLRTSGTFDVIINGHEIIVCCLGNRYPFCRWPANCINKTNEWKRCQGHDAGYDEDIWC